ncbi:response regulator [Lichenibacterium dinghuense]|uniref:response regulator n=1 Tax=Lichenibacterium dinghuense TaxID=2895977 RepID=UPI001F01B90D|nr:response regulator [Lichenibacterium sp. 6Y81]
MRLLLVEDNRDLARWLAEILRAGRYDVDIAHDGEEAEDCLRVTTYGLMILDLGLPGMGGGEVLRRLRARRNMMPVIVLTADGSLNARISGLDSGADDYLTKPFEVSELEARVRVQLRRSAGQADTVIRCGDLAFDTVGRSFALKNTGLALTPREAGVLEQLLRRAGRPVGKAALAEALFGFEETDPSAVEVYVHRLRKKLEGSSVSVATLRGLGYLLRSDEA